MPDFGWGLQVLSAVLRMSWDDAATNTAGWAMAFSVIYTLALAMGCVTGLIIGVAGTATTAQTIIETCHQIRCHRWQPRRIVWSYADPDAEQERRVLGNNWTLAIIAARESGDYLDAIALLDREWSAERDRLMRLHVGL